MLARHWTLDIQKIQLQKNECRAGTIFDIRHYKNEKTNVVQADIGHWKFKTECRAGTTLVIQK